MRAALALALVPFLAALPPAPAEAPPCEYWTTHPLGDGYVYYVAARCVYYEPETKTYYEHSSERYEYWVEDARAPGGARRVAGVAYEDWYVLYKDGSERTTHDVIVYADRAVVSGGYEETDGGPGPATCRGVADVDRGTNTGADARTSDLPRCMGPGRLLT